MLLWTLIVKKPLERKRERGGKLWIEKKSHYLVWQFSNLKQTLNQRNWNNNCELGRKNWKISIKEREREREREREKVLCPFVLFLGSFILSLSLSLSFHLQRMGWVEIIFIVEYYEKEVETKKWKESKENGRRELQNRAYINWPCPSGEKI